MSQELSITGGNADHALGMESSSNPIGAHSQSASIDLETSPFSIERSPGEIASSDNKGVEDAHDQNESLESESKEIIKVQKKHKSDGFDYWDFSDSDGSDGWDLNGSDGPNDSDDSDDSHGEVVSDLFQQNEAIPRSSDPETRAFAASITHPWHIVDYHLYLLQIEGQNDQRERMNNTMLRDGVECRPLWYDEYFEEDTFDPNLVGQQPSILFAALPVTDHGVQFNGSTYILEFNWNLRTLCARHFVWVPEDLRNIECVWKESVVTYRVPIFEIVEIMKYCLDQRYRRIEFLSINSRCITPFLARNDPGMELVIAYHFCQFAVDFARVLFSNIPDDEKDTLKSDLVSIMEEIRLTLQRASYRAWFAVREGLSMEKFSKRVSFDRYLNDLFTYNKSIEEGSLRGKEWHAPSLETCREIRDDNANKRQAKNEKQLNDVFTPPSPQESQEEMFANMVTKMEKSQVGAFLDANLSCPPIWCPILDELDFEILDIEDPESPVIVKSAVIEDDGHEVTEYHHVPLRRLFSHTYSLIQEHPEWDTLENRGRFGEILADLGVRIRKTPLDKFENVPEQGFDNDSWSLQVIGFNDSEEEASAPARRLLPSPVLD